MKSAPPVRKLGSQQDFPAEWGWEVKVYVSQNHIGDVFQRHLLHPGVWCVWGESPQQNRPLMLTGEAGHSQVC